MTFEVNSEIKGLRVKALIITATLETHSALQNLDRDYIETRLARIQLELNMLLNEAATRRKTP